MRYVLFLLRLLLGGVFIFSASTKLFPVELFEYTFVDMGIVSWEAAPVVARLFIGLEFLLGGWLVLGIAYKRFTLQAIFLLLVFFCVYLLYQVLVKKETGNCGCFGAEIIMTPAQALLKNVVLLLITVFLYVFPQPFLIRNKKVVIAIVILTVSNAFVLPFVINPLNAYKSPLKREVNYRAPLELLYRADQPEKPKVNLTRGKHLVAFLSLRCPHCKLAAYKLQVMYRKNPELPVYFVLNGNKKELPDFYKISNAQDIPYNFLKGKSQFLKFTGPQYPVILWINNGRVERVTTHVDLDQQEMEAWLRQ